MGVEDQRENLPNVVGVLANLILIPKKRHWQVGMHILRSVKCMIEFGTKIKQGMNLANFVTAHKVHNYENNIFFECLVG